MFRLFIEWQHAKELASIYILCYSTGDLFNTLLSIFVHSTCVQC